MDAFSLALIFGMSSLTSKQKISLSIIVGIYHFIMPIIGFQFGKIISQIDFISIDLIASIILAYIGIDLIISNFKEEDHFSISLVGFLLFGLSVSIDSLSVGIGLRAITNNYLFSALTFSITSFTFTYIGLNLGNLIGKKIGSYSKIFGGITLIIVAIIILIS